MTMCAWMPAALGSAARVALAPPAATAEVEPVLAGEGGEVLAQLLQLVAEEGMDTFSSRCPSLVNGLLWVVLHFDALPSLGRPVASVVCPAVQVSRWCACSMAE